MSTASSEKITRDDLEAKFRELQGDATDACRADRRYVDEIAAAHAVRAWCLAMFNRSHRILQRSYRAGYTDMPPCFDRSAAAARGPDRRERRALPTAILTRHRSA